MQPDDITVTKQGFVLGYCPACNYPVEVIDSTTVLPDGSTVGDPGLVTDLGVGDWIHMSQPCRITGYWELLSVEQVVERVDDELADLDQMDDELRTL